MIKENINDYHNNIRIFKKIYLSITFICFTLQLFLSETFGDYYIVTILLVLNILSVNYCFNTHYYNKFPISYIVVFFSISCLLSGSLIFKTLEFENISSGLFLPIHSTNILFICSLIILLTHYIYIKKESKNKKDSFFFLINQKLKLFDQKPNFLMAFGSIAIILLFVSRYLYKFGESTNTLETGWPIWYSIITGLSVFYLLPFFLIFSKKLFKKNYNINYSILLIFFVLLLMTSIGSNRRYIIFFGLVNILMIFLILFLLGRMNFNKKSILKYVLLIIIFLSMYEHIVKFNYVYVFERGQAEKRTFSENITSFKDSLFKYFYSEDSSYYMMRVEKIINTSYSDYYKNSFFLRLNYFEYADNILYNNKVFFSHEDVKEIRSYQFNRIIGIFPQPLINLFTNNFDKKDYQFVNTASKINNKFNPNYASSNDFGSFIGEGYLMFGFFFFLLLPLICLIYFYLLDSFFHKINGVFSPILLVSLFHYSLNLGTIFASASLDVLIFNSRVLIQMIFFYKIFEIFYKYINRLNSGNKN
tara:strand:- start:316 stop:1911 length:1596 start_codon:yes stop_codon:yes gene_type:complete